MRIVILTLTAPPDTVGGVGTYIEGLLSGLKSHNVRVHLVGATQHRHRPRVSTYDGATVRRVRITPPWAHTTRPRSRLWMATTAVWLNIVAIWYAIRTHRREGVDLIAVHAWGCAPAGLICGLLLRIPVCYHVHGVEFFHDGNGGWMATLIHKVDRALSRRAFRVVVPSAHVMADIPYLADRSDVVAISHGAGKAWQMACPDDIERTAIKERIRALYAIPETRRFLMYAGRYAPHKGVSELIEAVRLMLDDGVDLALIMAGTGWPGYVAMDHELHEKVAQLGLVDRVHVLGRSLDTDELRDHLVAADACVFPSRSETFGFAALEAMALRARTVVGPGFDTAVVGSTEGACLQTTTTDPAELAATLTRALGDEDPALGDRARRYVLDHHSWEATTARTLQVYAEAINRSARVRAFARERG